MTISGYTNNWCILWERTGITGPLEKQRTKQTNQNPPSKDKGTIERLPGSLDLAMSAAMNNMILHKSISSGLKISLTLNNNNKIYQDSTSGKDWSWQRTGYWPVFKWILLPPLNPPQSQNHDSQQYWIQVARDASVKIKPTCHCNIQAKNKQRTFLLLRLAGTYRQYSYDHFWRCFQCPISRCIYDSKDIRANPQYIQNWKTRKQTPQPETLQNQTSLHIDFNSAQHTEVNDKVKEPLTSKLPKQRISTICLQDINLIGG